MNRNRLPSTRRPPQITINSPNRGEFPNSDGSSSTTTPGSSRQLLPRRLTSGSSSRTPGLYGGPLGSADSAERLLTPSRSFRPFQEAFDDSPSPSGQSSRKTSFGSVGSNREGGYQPYGSPFEDSRAPSREGSEENINTQTIAEMYNIEPSIDCLRYPEDVEKDDSLHNPSPDDHKRDCNIWTKRGLNNIGGLILVIGGLLVLMIGYPLLSYAKREGFVKTSSCDEDPDCLSDKLPLLKNQRIGLIDPDTPKSANSKTAKDGTKLKLVFSDEFNTDGRTFYDGDDPFFQAVGIWYGVTQDLEWYDPDAVSTANGTLNIKFDAFQSHNLNYRSGMVQSWNKLCFTGGRMEASISLPGSGDTEGFWPGFWAMGNLGRPGYPATTDGMWPYSYHDECDVGITTNQSQMDGLSLLPGMRLPACTCEKEDHPNPGKSRSAPEIDAIEASVGFMGPGPYDAAIGTASQSFQAAPFDIFYQPDYNFIEIYDQSVTSMNLYRGGPFQEAVSALTWLNNDWYDGNGYQTYGFEYNPGASGDITWFVGDEYTWKLDARALRPNGNIQQRVIPVEPMSVIMNFGMSNSFAQVFLANIAEKLPATMRFDYIRIYQPEGSESVTCDPEDYPTTKYIKQHSEAYNNPNLTLWNQTPYSWPQNTFVNGCS